MSDPATSVGGEFRFAILGCGRMGRVHAARLLQDSRARVTALHDVDPTHSANLRDSLAPEAAICRRVDDLWSLSDVDAAVICTPTASHFEQVIQSRDLGWSVLCEKPLTESLARTRTLIELTRNSAEGPSVSIAYQRRSWATFRTLRREVLSGRWGAVRAIELHTTERWQQTIAGTWRDDPTINMGGFVGDAGSHKLDALFYTTGVQLAEIFARSSRCGSQVEIVSSVSAVSVDDVPVIMDFVGNAQHQAEDLHIHCEHADLMVRDYRVWIARENRVEPLTPLEPDANPISTFLDMLDGSGPNVAPIECAWPVCETTEAILQSAALGRPVTLPLGDP